MQFTTLHYVIGVGGFKTRNSLHHHYGDAWVGHDNLIVHSEIICPDQCSLSSIQMFEATYKLKPADLVYKIVNGSRTVACKKTPDVLNKLVPVDVNCTMLVPLLPDGKVLDHLTCDLCKIHRYG